MRSAMLLLSAVVLLLASSAEAHQPIREAGTTRIRGTEFARAVKVGEERLDLRGGERLRYLFFNVYTAAFYLSDSVPSRPSAFLGQEAAYLVLEYHRTIQAEDFIEATKRGLEKDPNTPWDTIEAQLEELYAMFERVGSGDRYCITSYPDGRLEIRLNGELRGAFEGREFAAAFLGIWVGDNPLSRPVRDRLLGL